MKNNLRLTLIPILNVRVEDNIIQVQSQVILQDKAEIYEDVFYKKESRSLNAEAVSPQEKYLTTISLPVNLTSREITNI